MNHLNSVLIEGELLRDPFFRITAKGKPVCTFIIVNRRIERNDSNTAENVENYLDVEAWGKLAESVHSSGHAGRGVRVVGAIREYHWAGINGDRNSRVIIVAEHVEFRPEQAEKPPKKPRRISTAKGK